MSLEFWCPLNGELKWDKNSGLIDFTNFVLIYLPEQCCGNTTEIAFSGTIKK
jgi:hypothetical protein